MMPKSRSTLRPPARPSGEPDHQGTTAASLLGGNGKQPVEDRLTRLEAAIETLQEALDRQFARTAAIHAEPDALNARRT